MNRDDWADSDIAMGAFFDWCPVFELLSIEERELWHQFARVAEAHETDRLITSLRGRHPRKVVAA